jgi:hypothetical protein
MEQGNSEGVIQKVENPESLGGTGKKKVTRQQITIEAHKGKLSIDQILLASSPFKYMGMGVTIERLLRRGKRVHTEIRVIDIWLWSVATTTATSSTTTKVLLY